MATKNTVDSESAKKLADLTADMSHKISHGQITMNHLKCFLGLSKAERDKMVFDRLQVWKTVAIPEMEGLQIDLIKVDFALIGLNDLFLFHRDVHERVKKIFGLELCPMNIEELLWKQDGSLNVGCMFVNDPILQKKLRVYCLVNVPKLMSDME